MGEERGGKAYEADDDGRDDGVPAEVRLEARGEGQRLAVDALRLRAGIEAEVRDTDTKPAHEASDGGHVDEPVEDSMEVCYMGFGATIKF